MASNMTSASVNTVHSETVTTTTAPPSQPVRNVAGNAIVRPPGNQYFYEDEVFKFDSNGRVRFGVVMETYEEAASDSERSDHEDILKKREIRVAWHPRGTIEVTQEQYVSTYIYNIYTTSIL